MYSPLTRFFNKEKFETEKLLKKREQEEKTRKNNALERLRLDKDFQEFVVDVLKKRLELFSDISNMPDKGDLEKEIFGRKQKLAELQIILHNINGSGK